jgi:RNA polymerase sigma factor (sigma-70 family)
LAFLLTDARGGRPPARSDARLVSECLAGKEEAWVELIEKYKALIYSIPIKYGLPHQEAADVFQSVCAELFARLPELRKPQALPKWLMQVAHHECYRWRRTQQRVVSRDTEPDLPEPGVPPIAEEMIRRTEEEQTLREAISDLSPQCQRLVEALFLDSPARPYTEIAAELGLAVGSIGFTRQKCIERLRKSLEKAGLQ